VIIKRAHMKTEPVERCHDGVGRMASTTAFSRPDSGPGFRFVHDNVLDPGASIGEHLHTGDEEIYLVLEGEGTMIEDGRPYPVTAGDLCITTAGHSHGLRNGPTPMRLLVVGVLPAPPSLP
jgi:mannose-6-phosphate isomerase-like protein (cupin superfamily)